jgi:hypothetical protein
MPKLRLKITRQRTQETPMQSHSLIKEICEFAQEKINRILDNDVLPLIIAPSIFIIFAGLEWWRWYLEIPTPIPLLLTVIALGLGAYCFYKLFGHKRKEDLQKNLQAALNRHPELH